MIEILPYSLASLAIAALYYAWRDRIRSHIRRLPAELLRQRVAYMMWIAAKN